jgi:hypothetical protein
MEVIMRHFLVLFLVVFASLHPQAQASVNGGVQAETPSQHKNEPGSSPQPAAPRSAFNKVHNGEPSEANSDQKKHYGQRDTDERVYRVHVESEPTSPWTIAYVCITALLGLLGFGTLVALIYQNGTLRKQVRLQERAQRQWVNTSDWKAGITTDSDGKFAATISCAISNVTHAPITLILVSLASEDHQGIRNDEGFPRNTLLLPSNPIRHNCLVPLTSDQVDAFTHRGLLFKLSGMILYTDALEDTWTQNFRLVLAASPTSVSIGNYFHTLGKVRSVEMWEVSSGQMFQNVEMPQPLWRKALDWWIAQVEAMKNGNSNSG